MPVACLPTGCDQFMAASFLPLRTTADQFHVALILHHDNTMVACEYAKRPNKAKRLPHHPFAPITALHWRTISPSHLILDTTTYSHVKPRASPSWLCRRRRSNSLPLDLVLCLFNNLPPFQRRLHCGLFKANRLAFHKPSRCLGSSWLLTGTIETPVPFSLVTTATMAK